jgi:Cu(I)/Ag(I) efflux system membrane fusion protein
MRKLISNKYVHYFFFAIVGLFMGWLFFYSHQHKENVPTKTTTASSSTIWTCSMHPQIRKHESGKCPLCGMDLIPLVQNETTFDSSTVSLSDEAIELANVQTSVITKHDPQKEVRLYGKVQTDERLLQSQVAHVPGRIEKLLVNFTGESIYKGQTLAIIYAPELVTAQQELIETSKTKDTQPELYEASKEKLHQWRLTEAQIAKIENSGTTQTNFEIVSNTSGIVTARKVNTGDYVSAGTILYDIADLSKLWLMFDAYESDLQFLNIGNKISFTVQALPGMIYSGKINFIDPVIDPVTRVSKVRVEINNNSGKLKPEMFATGIVQATLTEYKNKLIVPRSAVLWTGKRSIVYVKQTNTKENTFKIREIGIGPQLGNGYVVNEGLAEGEEIVAQGAYSVDAAAQLEGKPSMMNHISTDQNQEKKEIISANENSQILRSESFLVSGNCEQCKDRIEKAAKSIKGVSSGVWNASTRKILIQFNPSVTNRNSIEIAIAKSGHDTEKHKATTEIYNKLPECCKYR